MNKKIKFVLNNFIWCIVACILTWGLITSACSTKTTVTTISEHEKFVFSCAIVSENLGAARAQEQVILLREKNGTLKARELMYKSDMSDLEQLAIIENVWLACEQYIAEYDNAGITVKEPWAADYDPTKTR